MSYLRGFCVIGKVCSSESEGDYRAIVERLPLVELVLPVSDVWCFASSLDF